MSRPLLTAKKLVFTIRTMTKVRKHLEKDLSEKRKQLIKYLLTSNKDYLKNDETFIQTDIAKIFNISRQRLSGICKKDNGIKEIIKGLKNK